MLPEMHVPKLQGHFRERRGADRASSPDVYYYLHFHHTHTLLSGDTSVTFTAAYVLPLLPLAGNFAGEGGGAATSLPASRRRFPRELPEGIHRRPHGRSTSR